MCSSYRSNRLCLSHWDPYAVHRGGCLELCCCNMVEWFWSDLDDQLVIHYIYRESQVGTRPRCVDDVFLR